MLSFPPVPILSLSALGLRDGSWIQLWILDRNFYFE